MLHTFKKKDDINLMLSNNYGYDRKEENTLINTFYCFEEKRGIVIWRFNWFFSFSGNQIDFFLIKISSFDHINFVSQTYAVSNIQSQSKSRAVLSLNVVSILARLFRFQPLQEIWFAVTLTASSYTWILEIIVNFGIWLYHA